MQLSAIRSTVVAPTQRSVATHLSSEYSVIVWLVCMRATRFKISHSITPGLIGQQHIDQH